jgi:hypothetical protein
MITHTISFKNICDQTICVSATAADGSKFGNSVPPGNSRKLTCFDTKDGKGCHGFTSWEASC